MMTLTRTTVEQAFLATLRADPSQRTQAESVLAQLERHPGHLGLLLDIIADPAAPASPEQAAVRQAAAVYFKNRIARAWDIEAVSPNDAVSSPAVIEVVDRQAVRAGILTAIVRTYPTPALRDQLVTALYSVVTFDYPQYWAEFPQLVLEMLRSEDIAVVRCGLLSLRELMKAFRFRAEERRVALNPVIEHLFPVLLDIAARLTTVAQQGSEDPVPAEMLVVIFKSFFAAIQYFLPPVLINTESMQRWSQTFVDTIRAPSASVPGADASDDDDTRAQTPIWKAKKWAMHCLNRIFTRYGNPAMLAGDSDKYMEFANWYIANIAPGVLEVYLATIATYTSSTDAYVSPRCRCLISNYLTDAVKHKLTWKLLKAHTDALVQQWIFPELCWRPALDRLWKEDPIEYVQRHVDPIEDYRSPVSAAIQLLLTLVEDRKKVAFLPTLQFVNHQLLVDRDTAPELRDPRRKAGAMAMMAHMSMQMIGKKSPVRAQMEEFLTVHILPEYASQHPYLRARACEVIEAFAELEFNDASNHMLFLQRTLACLEDQELPVRVRGALALHPLVQHDALREAMTPHLATIMAAFLRLTNEIDLDTLGNVMEEFVGVYAEQLTPFAVQLCEQLRDTCMQVLSEAVPAVTGPKQDRDWDEVADRVMAAQSILRTLFTLITSLDEDAHPDLFPTIERTLLPLHQFVLEHAVVDMYEELFEIIEACIFTQRAVTPAAWELFISVMRAFELRGEDFVDIVVPCLDNYVSFGATTIAGNPEVLRQLVGVVESIMNPLNERVTETDRNWGCRLMESLLLNCRGGVDQYLGRFVDIAGGYLTNPEMMEKHVKTDVLRLYLIETWINALLYNPAATLAALAQRQWLLPFFQLWFSHLEKYPRVHDKQLQLLALCALAECDPAHIPTEVQSAFGDVGRAMIQLLRTYPEAVAKRQDLEDLAGDGDSDDDDSDFAGAELQLDDEDDEGDVLTEEREYLEMLAVKAAEGNNDDYEDDEEADVLFEELNFESPLDKVNLWAKFRDTMQGLQLERRQVYSALISLWTAEDQAVAAEASQRADLPAIIEGI